MGSARSDDPPLDLVIEEMLDYIEQAGSYTQGMTFDQYSSDANIFRHEYRYVAARIVWDTVRLHLPELKAVARAIEAELPSRDEQA